MTYSEIKQLALKQMDQDPHDMEEFADLLNVYVNEGYQIALMDYAKPREEFILTTDEDGNADISGLRIHQLIKVESYPAGYSAFEELDELGEKLHTVLREAKIRVVAHVSRPDMAEDSDEPKLPEWAHNALADYACYRYLANGNMAKQSRAQFYYGQFLTTMRRIRPQGMGSVTHKRNLYAATDTNWVR